MIGEQMEAARFSLNDGLGERWLATRPPHGRVEVLDLAPTLAGHAPAEGAIRARAARLADLDIPTFPPVRRIERDAAGLRTVAEATDGTRLSAFLARLQSSGEVLSHAGMLELGGVVVRAVAALHRMPGGLTHGAVTPAHVVLARDGVILTDGVFGAALESLQLNREQLWRQFGVALPASASLPRFDQRADVTQLGACVLAVALRRPLAADEYPRNVADLVLAATQDTGAPGATALRLWLQQALQLHPRATFASAVDAERAFDDIGSATPGLRRAGMKALAALLPAPRMLIA